ncbi:MULTISPECIES: polysaccharide biosynthesis tyrosine autokinase [Protofrankia]|uniref:Capsular exopolysaccharide family n=1 Tax=Candidatus Protofrankia datiscae TaxID=2716812 RepID=F8B2G2_9ACTN|nr:MULTISPECIES: polysaccharide biosynthesis tyrosine autokinase [Protofrankia]AEH10842.1 capsular exopolysaccharide family [Candidatus Protofrankia datiscae]
MELREYVRALRRGWPLIVICVLLGGLFAAAVSWRQTPAYAAVTTMVVSSSDTTDSAAAAYQGGLLSQQRVKSYADLVASDRVAAAVVDKLHLDESPQWLRGRIQAQTVPETVLLRAVVTDTDPHRAQLIADTVGEVFSQAIAQIESPSPDKAPLVRVSVWEKAKTPTRPISPQPVRAVAFGVLAGLLASVAAAVVRHRFDTRVTTAADITAASGLATLGTIAFDATGAQSPLIVPEGGHSASAEAFRQLRTNLRFVDVDAPPRTILVSSSMPDEGKTTTTCRLAVTLAQTGARVALVEGDLRRPSFGDCLGIETAAGLTSVLIGTAGLDDVLLPWGDVDGRLHVLPSGPLPPNPSELLGSRGMSDLLGELSARFDFVLIDTPPLLPVTDAAVLAAQTDGTVLIVRASRTRREQVARAADALRLVDARILGAVLTMVPVKGPDAAYDGYHAYGGYAPADPPRAFADHPVLIPAAARSDRPGGGRPRTDRPQAELRIAAQHQPYDHPVGGRDSATANTRGDRDQLREQLREQHRDQHRRAGGTTAVAAGTELTTERPADLADDSLTGRLTDSQADDATTPLTLNARPAGSHRRKRGQ